MRCWRGIWLGLWSLRRVCRRLGLAWDWVGLTLRVYMSFEREFHTNYDMCTREISVRSQE